MDYMVWNTWHEIHGTEYMVCMVVNLDWCIRYNHEPEAASGGYRVALDFPNVVVETPLCHERNGATKETNSWTKRCVGRSG